MLVERCRKRVIFPEDHPHRDSNPYEYRIRLQHVIYTSCSLVDRQEVESVAYEIEDPDSVQRIERFHSIIGRVPSEYPWYNGLKLYQCNEGRK
jgi:hypothetical protein